MTTNNKQ